MSTSAETTPDTGTTQRTLSFRNDENSLNEAEKGNFEKSIHDRLKILQAILPDYSSEVDITE